MAGIDPVMVTVLIATPIVGVAFVLVWRWQTNKWARTERHQLRHADDYEDALGEKGGSGRPKAVVVRDDEPRGPSQ